MRRAQVALALGCAAWWAAVELAPRAEPAPPVLVPCAAGTIDAVELREGRRAIHARVGETIWIGVDVTTAGGGPTDHLEVRGDARARAAIDALAGLRSLRALGALGPDDRREAGLEDPATLVVRCAGAEHRLALGRAIGPGQRRAERGGAIHLVDGRAVSDLLAAEVRLQDRAVLGIDVDRADVIEVRAADARVTLRRRWDLAERGFAREDGSAGEASTRLAGRVAELAAHGWIPAADPEPAGGSVRLELAIAERAGPRAELRVACTDPPRARCWVSGGAAAPDRAFVVPALALDIASEARALAAAGGAPAVP